MKGQRSLCHPTRAESSLCTDSQGPPPWALLPDPFRVPMEILIQAPFYPSPE